MTQNVPPKTGPTGDMAVSITNPNSALGGIYATLSAFGNLMVALDPLNIFSDPFEGVTVETTNRWTTTGTVAPTQTTGSLFVNPAATASATSAITSLPTFTFTSPQSIGFVATLEAATATGNHRFMGFGTPPSAPGTAAAPLYDAIGFEIDTSGVMRCSVYTQGTRTFTQVLATPTDGLSHRYVVTVRGDIAMWFKDSFDLPVATTQVQPNTQILPARFASLNSASVTGTPTMTVIGVAVLDHARCATQVADGTYHWRKAKVGPYGDQSVSIVNPVGAAAGLAVGVTTYGFMRATVEPHYLFNDPFDGGMDVTNRWTLSGTTVPTMATQAGRVSISPGATLSGTSIMASQPTFSFFGLNFLANGWIAQFEASNAASGGLFYLNSHRFMGYGTPPATLSAAYTASAATGPMLDAIGYEIDVDGRMYPVVYTNGVRTRPSLTFGGTDFNTGNGAPISTTNPGGSRTLADGLMHSFGLAVRGDYIFWYVDGSDYPSAQLTFKGANYTMPNTQTQPLRFHQVNGAASAPSGTMIFRMGSVGVADTGSNHAQLADGTYPWRKAQISKSGGLALTPAPALPTYTVVAETATGLFSAGTRKDYLSIEHAAAATKTLRLLRVAISGYQTTALVGTIWAKIFYGTAATSAGTVQASTATNAGVVAAEAVCKILPTVTAATLKYSAAVGAITAATANIGFDTAILYDSMDAVHQPMTLRQGQLECLCIALYSNVAHNITPQVTVIFSEE